MKKLLLTPVLAVILSACTFTEDVAVSSMPEGANVFVNNELVGQTPTIINLQTNGVYDIKLVKKGYVEKNRSQVDGRVVHIKLTREGRRANTAHRYFHTRMVRAIANGLSPEEQSAMLKGMQKLNLFFNQNINRNEGET